MKEKKRKINKRLGLIFLLSVSILIGSFFCLHVLFPLSTQVDFSPVVTDRNGEILYSFLNDDDKWRLYLEEDKISDDLKQTILFKEDKYFYYHFGVNPIAIGRALFNNITQNKRTSGASTITMQVVRLLEPRPRTYGSKLIEIFRSLQLEWMLSKDEILQLYLNLVPYGGNIEGVQSAAVLYFNKQANNLSLAEITALSVIPNRPSSLKIGEHNEELLAVRNKWLKKMEKADLFPQESIHDALEEPLEASRLESPKFAPHFSYRMQNAYPDMDVVRTTLSKAMQNNCERAVSEYMKTKQAYNVHNAAVLVVDNATNEVLAYVGSADFYGTEDAGQVDGIRAVRQPGSTLKPLIYALSIEDGLLTPKTVLTDVPINFHGYTPVNFNQEFNGYINVENALAQSLNIPAVKALEQLGVERATEALITCDFKTIERQEEILGLSLVLGGCGVSLEEMTALYTMFANKGIYQPISYLLESESDSTQILSPSTSFMLSEILQQLERPDLPNSWRSSKNLPALSWKTGTSYGRKDAWSIGYNDKYTVGVWVGNFSGEGVPELTGANFASPLLFKIFNTIDPSPTRNWLTAPVDLKYRKVCASSGKIPSDDCDEIVLDYFLPTISSNATCKHVKKCFVSADESYSYCQHCLPEAGYKVKNYPNHPPEILAFYRENQINYLGIPTHNPACENWKTANPPQIVSPSNGAIYYINPKEPESLVLRCNTASDVESVFWFVNQGVYREASTTEGVLFLPDSEGIYTISCSDDQGRNSTIQFEVIFL